MFAVISFGDKQYKVFPGESIEIERLDVEENTNIEVKDVLLVHNDNTTIIDSNELKKYKILGQVLKQFRDDKVIIFKKKRRKDYTRKRGHRQYKTILLVKDIVCSN